MKRIHETCIVRSFIRQTHYDPGGRIENLWKQRSDVTQVINKCICRFNGFDTEQRNFSYTAEIDRIEIEQYKMGLCPATVSFATVLAVVCISSEGKEQRIECFAFCNRDWSGLLVIS